MHLPRFYTKNLVFTVEELESRFHDNQRPSGDKDCSSYFDWKHFGIVFSFTDAKILTKDGPGKV